MYIFRYTAGAPPVSHGRESEALMRINGIIAEYNPFHNGHRFQLEESLRLTGARYTVVVMSGNFVQRGAPALVNKYKRAEMALLSGADLVLELPVLYASSSAEYFATGAVTLLDRLGAVTDLCFGSECGDAGLLRGIAEILLEEPPAYKNSLKQYLREGKSFPAARAEALIQNYPFLSGQQNVFTSPNNILGIEYIKALCRRKSAMNAVTVRRTGSGYHSRFPEEDQCSALAIRQALYAGADMKFLKNNMPAQAAEVLAGQLEKTGPVRSNDLSEMLYYKLLEEKETGYDTYLDVSSDLSDRIRGHLNGFKNYEDFCDQLKTKEMTYTRISRCLLHILLGLKKSDMEQAQALGFIPYARILGFKKASAPLLGEIRARASVPLITKLADAGTLLDRAAYEILDLDIRTSQLYNGIVSHRTSETPQNEISTSPVIL